MKPFNISFEGHSILVRQLENKEFELYFSNELIAIITPRMKCGGLTWQSPHIETSQAQLIGSIIATKLIELISDTCPDEC